MNFKSIEEKRQFLNTAINKGIEAAKREYIKQHYPLVVICKTEGPYAEMFGQKITAEQIKQKYPGILVVVVEDTRTKEEIENLGQ
jgi:hypothetical protein